MDFVDRIAGEAPDLVDCRDPAVFNMFVDECVERNIVCADEQHISGAPLRLG